MGTSLPFAFSVHHFISSVGADAGFAAIIGLAILVLLYFAQARETANLRDRAEDAAAHLQELETRLAQLSRSGVGSATGTIAPTPAPPGLARPAVAAAPAIAAARTGSAAPVAARTAAPVAVPVAQAGVPPAPAGVPAAPAGVGAPALSAATRLIPDPEREAVAFHANGAPASGGTAVLTPSPPPPSTAAGGANGSSTPPGGGAGGSDSPAAGVTTAAGAGPITRPPARPAGRGAPPPRRPGAAGPGRAGARGGGSRISRGLIAAITVLGVAAVVVVLLVVTSTSSSTHTSSTASQTTNAQTAKQRTHRTTGAVKPASVTVSVLNGTSTSNLAHTVAQQLGAAGFKEGSILTATDQTLTATVVGYMPGHRSDALIVAKSLKLGSASVQPVDQSNKTVACPASSTPCTAQVVVTVGSDLANP